MTSLLSRIHQKFNVSVAEYGDYDLWQRITIITCIASADPDFPNQLLERIISFVAETRLDLELIDCSTELENIRKKNNTNWMNLLRLAFKYAPNEANKIIKKINADDKKISKQLQKLQD